VQQTDDAIFGFLVEHSPDGHFILVDSSFVYLNAAAQEMFGVQLKPGQSISVYDIIDPSDHDRARKNQTLRVNGVLKGAQTYTARRRGGETFPVEIHSAPLKLRGRKGLHGVIRDVTERAVMEGRLEQMQREGLVSRLASGIAHDFNNLLAVIQTNTEVAQRAGSGTEVQDALKRIRAAVQRGSEKVRHIQRMGSRREGAREQRPLYVNPVVEDMLDLTRARWRDEAESLGISYEVDWGPGMPPPIEGAEDDLRAALVALVFNALEAMPGGGRIRISTSRDAQGDCLITVRDEGEGIDPAALARLTDAFYTTRPDRQMGLGLHLVANVLERHGGRLEVDSTPSRGSTFAMILPASGTAPSEAPPPPRADLFPSRSKPTVPEPVRPKTRGSNTVLLIDDQADLVQVVRTILESRGFSVDTALNGRDGVELLGFSKYSIVLTDLGMPDISGWEVAARVREVQPDTPIILMTGWAADIDEARLREAEIQALLPKPFRSDQLLSMVKQVLNSSRSGLPRP
jgi:PAS domain S-box-containing protein